MKRITAILLAVAMLLVSAGTVSAEDAPAPETGQAEAPAEVSTGGTILFGRYIQTGLRQEKTPVEWTVLEVKDGKALVISRFGLSGERYHDNHKNDVTWEDSELRAWLNGRFLKEAFTEEELQAIQVTEVDNGPAQGYSGWNTDGGNNTQDRIFLLSCAEANRYFGVTPENKENVKARVQPTEYALEQRAKTGPDLTELGGNAGWWWLRSPGSVQTSAAIVDTDGALGESPAAYITGCSRPAMWLDLEAETVRAGIWKAGPLESADLAETDAIRMRDGTTPLTLSIREYGFSKDNHTDFAVTVDGYDVLKAAKKGSVTERIPFQAAIAWKDGGILRPAYYGISYTGEPITVLHFVSVDGTPVAEPDYILIAKKDGEIGGEWCYVIADGHFHPAAEVLPFQGTAADGR